MVAVVQLVERQDVALEVAGSSPVGHPMSELVRRVRRYCRRALRLGYCVEPHHSTGL